MSGISTHVLDTVRGKPASGIRVRLERKIDRHWRLVGTGKTDCDGRCLDLLDAVLLTSATYRLTFETRPYFELQSIAYLYPEIIITFLVRGDETHYHLPLLLGPNTYTTYRGS